MKLLDVKAVLGRETAIHQFDFEHEVLKELDDEDTRYAILSHRWGTEVGYEEMVGLMKMEERKRDEVRQRSGYQKIIESCKQAMKDGYEWLWVDTCCIDKRSSSELSEAINSMYRWYRNAQVCYAYLNDVDKPFFPVERNDSKFDKSNGWPEWFVRGWTLQELIAPKQVEFFNEHWVPIGDKWCLAPVLEEITGIPCEVLTSGLAAKRLSVAQIMSWAADRKTTRVEDRAYSLMGLFGVNMPMLYGEGKKAFQRLQLEIIRVSGDQSILAWHPQKPRSGSVLAEDPSDFRCCGRFRRVEPGEFVDRLVKEFIQKKGHSYSLRIDIPGSNRRARWRKLAALRGVVDSQQFRTFTVNNAGIQVFLPVLSSPDFPFHFTAILACCNDSVGFDNYLGFLVTIDLVSSGTSFDRTSVNRLLPTACLEFKTLHLTHHRDASEMQREFTIDDKHASYHGFTRCSTFPREFKSNAVTLSSLTEDLIVLVYTNEGAGTRFAVGLGYYFGRGWVHVVYDDCPGTREEYRTPWSEFPWRAYHRMWNARTEHAQSMPKQEYDYKHRNDHFVKHAHLPRSIWAARVVWGRWEMDNFKVMVDVEECPGCCDGPSGWTTTSNDCGGLSTPGLMSTVYHPYQLRLDGWQVRLGGCSDQSIALGDYGDYSNGSFVRTGNIFEDAETLGIDLGGSAYCPVVHRIFDFGPRIILPVAIPNGYTVATHDMHETLLLYQPKGFSLPANDHLVLLLKALSTCASGKHLVITVVRCSDFRTLDYDRDQRDSMVGFVHCYTDDNNIEQRNSGDEAEILTPLCIIASPQVWRRGPAASVQKKEQFKNIREHFCILVNMHQPRTQVRQKSASRHKKRAIAFFSDMFGLSYLKHYVGEIMFFERLSRVMETASLDKGTVEGDAKLPAHPPKLSFISRNVYRGNRPSNTVQDPRLEAVVPLLLKRCQEFRVDSEEMRHELKSISQSLSAGLLVHISTTFDNAARVSPTDQGSYIYDCYTDYDRQFNTHAEIQQLQELKVRLDATEDDDERRTLEEDVTGKILWLCWCGICKEVDQLLPMVLDCIQREGSNGGLYQMSTTITPTDVDPDHDQTHLQRIMLDAGAGISKHRLFLSARRPKVTLRVQATINPTDESNS